VRRAFELGARGYVYKSQMEDLTKAIHIAVAGGVYNPLN
jgi:DNA-binding NarL/FixJ family response regulator